MPKSYPWEFRRRVVDLCRAGRVPRLVAGDLSAGHWVGTQALLPISGRRGGPPFSTSIAVWNARRLALCDSFFACKRA
jgi:hypothetical protein